MRALLGPATVARTLEFMNSFKARETYHMTLVCPTWHAQKSLQKAFANMLIHLALLSIPARLVTLLLAWVESVVKSGELSRIDSLLANLHIFLDEN